MPFIARMTRQVTQFVTNLEVAAENMADALAEATRVAVEHFPLHKIDIEMEEVTVPDPIALVAPSFRVDDDGTIREGQAIDGRVIGKVGG